ncbi:MAG: 50S ribosomal protein L6 [Candidatus Micrarchaeota archaeon]
MEIEIPKDSNLRIEGNCITLKIGAEEHLIKFNSQKLKVAQKDGKVEILPIKKTRRETHAMANSIGKHLKNLFSGGKKQFEKKLQVVYAHFPVSVEVKGKEIYIKNFLGEKRAREANVIGNTQVQVSGQDIIIKGSDIEAVGQTAANIIQAVRITGKDRRVFQDGIYLVK